MKDRLKHLLFYVLISLIFMPSIVWAGCDSEALKNEIPRDRYRDKADLNLQKGLLYCTYYDAIGSCEYDNPQKKEVSSQTIEFNIQDYVGKDSMKIIVVYYDKITYNAQGAYSHTDNYYMCVDGKMEGKPYCYGIDETQKVMLDYENKYREHLGDLNLYYGYKPYEFTEKEFLTKIDDNANCPDMWKKCNNGWSQFYISDPGDGKLLKKYSNFVQRGLDTPEIGSANCATLFGSPKDKNAPAYFLSFAFKVVRFISIILLIVLSALDFLQASASQDSDEIKKSFTKTMKRMVLCILIFVLPILLEFVLSIVNEKDVDLCISTSLDQEYEAGFDTDSNE